MVINEIYYYHLIKIEIKNEVTKRPKYSFRKNNYKKQRSSSLDFYRSKDIFSEHKMQRRNIGILYRLMTIQL